jgi:RNA 3'-terminal phosphate cyclase (ATP)
LALSLLTQRPLQIERIRAGRPKPGLMRQHLTCVKAALAIGGGQVQGAEMGSTRLHFVPSATLHTGEHHFHMPGAGSTLLVLQTVLPALLMADAPCTLHLQGGTHNPLAPPFEAVAYSYAPLLRRLGVGLALQLHRRGFMPAGGGCLEVHVTPTPTLTPFDVCERGPLVHTWAEAVAPHLKQDIPLRELHTLSACLNWPSDIGPSKMLRLMNGSADPGPGNALTAVLAYERSAETVARLVAQQVAQYQRSAGVLGEHLADQWMLPLAVAVWRSGQAARYTCTHLSTHTHTQAHTIPLGLPVHIGWAKLEDGCTHITIRPAAQATCGANSPL